MGVLNTLGISAGANNAAAATFEKLFPSFLDVSYETPSDYVGKYWKTYLNRQNRNNNLNGKVFEYILATLFVRENILPLYLNATVALVPNVIYDLMFYTDEKGPICLSAKTSLRERYKQADLEAIALKYVHRRAESYLLTLDETEAENVKMKIKSGDVIGLNKVVVATKPDFDELVASLKQLTFSDPPTFKVINSNQIITEEKKNQLSKHL